MGITSGEDPWDAIKARCLAAKIDCEEFDRAARYNPSRDPSLHETMLVVRLPNGDSTSAVRIFQDQIEEFAGIEFESFQFLADYVAIWNSARGEIEALLTRDSSSPRDFYEIIRNIGNFEDLGVGPASEGSPAGSARNLWRIRAARETMAIEVSPPSRAFRLLATAVSLRMITLKISGCEFLSYEEALQGFQAIANAVVFELDARHTLQLQLMRYQSPAHPSRGPGRRPHSDEISCLHISHGTRRSFINMPLRLQACRFCSSLLTIKLSSSSSRYILAERLCNGCGMVSAAAV